MPRSRMLPSTLAAALVAAGLPAVAAAPPAHAADTARTGFAAVDALGQNGTTGGAGGPTVTVTTTAQFLDYISRPVPTSSRSPARSRSPPATATACTT